MIAATFVVAFVLGVALGYFFISRPKKIKYFARGEYWVYLPGEQMPDENDLMTRMVGRNPYTKRGQSPIGPPEGLIFADVRLHIALVLKRKNVQAFRPDLFDEGAALEPGMLEALANANSFVKIRYISEQVLPDKRHLQFLIHAADAIADLGSGTLIYDHVAERLFERKELQTLLSENFDATGADVHVRLLWKPDGTGGHIETRGLVKLGLCELATYQLPADQRVIGTSLIESMIRKAWQEAKLSLPAEFEEFGAGFKIVLDSVRGQVAKVRILRVVGA